MNDNPSPHFQDADHALLAGMLIGTLMKAGVDVWVPIDDDLNYMNEMVVTLEDGIKVKIKVLPPID